jgi:hypothetical protein
LHLPAGFGATSERTVVYVRAFRKVQRIVAPTLRFPAAWVTAVAVFEFPEALLAL